jgi:hypothetical protein
MGYVRPLSVMPGFMPGIHVLQRVTGKDVDGRDKPGHDNGETAAALRRWTVCEDKEIERQLYNE